jgi:hypothetical protein
LFALLSEGTHHSRHFHGVWERVDVHAPWFKGGGVGGCVGGRLAGSFPFRWLRPVCCVPSWYCRSCGSRTALEGMCCAVLC